MMMGRALRVNKEQDKEQDEGQNRRDEEVWEVRWALEDLRRSEE